MLHHRELQRREQQETSHWKRKGEKEGKERSHFGLTEAEENGVSLCLVQSHMTHGFHIPMKSVLSALDQLLLAVSCRL